MSWVLPKKKKKKKKNEQKNKTKKNWRIPFINLYVFTLFLAESIPTLIRVQSSTHANQTKPYHVHLQFQRAGPILTIVR
jgi:hypothetical protein